MKRKSATASILLFLFVSPQAFANPLSFLWTKEKRVNEESLNLSQAGKTDEAVSTLKPLLAEQPDSPELNYNLGTILIDGKKFEEGREQLERVNKTNSAIKAQSLFNTAGSFAQENKKNEARIAYAELIEHLTNKESLSAEEGTILSESKKNLAALSNPNSNQNQENQQQNDSQKNQENQNQSDKQDKNTQNNQDEKDSQKDQKKQNEPKDSSDKNNQDKKEKNTKEDNKETQKDEKKSSQEQNQEKKQQDQQPKSFPTKGRQPFRERDNMGEQEAKQILEALKQQESNLQKKFLKTKEGDKLPRDDNGKDW